MCTLCENICNCISFSCTRDLIQLNFFTNRGVGLRGSENHGAQGLARSRNNAYVKVRFWTFTPIHKCIRSTSKSCWGISKVKTSVPKQMKYFCIFCYDHHVDWIWCVQLHWWNESLICRNLSTLGNSTNRECPQHNPTWIYIAAPVGTGGTC